MMLAAACEQPSPGSTFAAFEKSARPIVVQPEPEQQDSVPSYVNVKPKTVVCPECNGTGFCVDPYGDEDDSPVCKRCQGKRYFTVY